jgi:hypothetical protein
MAAPTGYVDHIRITVYYTEGSIPTVTTQAASSVEAITAIGNGNITATSPNADHRGFVWDTSSKGAPGNVAPASSGYASSVDEAGYFGTGAFTGSITGLAPAATIYVRAYAHNAQGYAYGDEVSFKTGIYAFVSSGVVVSAGRSITTTRLAGIAFGIVAAATAPRKGFIRYASIVIGNAVAAIKGVTVTRASVVKSGVSVTSSRRITTTRLSSVVFGEVVSALKSKTFIRYSSVASGVKVTASRSISVIRHSAVAFGNLVTFSVKGRILKIVTTISGYRAIRSINSAYRKILISNSAYRKIKTRNS